jgi:hypothetical protein
MSVRKRTWKTTKGEIREAWVVAYVDQNKTPRIRTFDKKSEAKAWETSMRVEIRDGTHTAFSQSSTVKDAADKWLATAQTAGLEKTTTDEYRRHADMNATWKVAFCDGVEGVRNAADAPSGMRSPWPQPPPSARWWARHRPLRGRV